MPCPPPRIGHEFHLHVGLVAPEQLLDLNAVDHRSHVRRGRPGDVVEVSKILPRLSRRQNFAAFDEQAEEIDFSAIEWDQGILSAVHDHDRRRAVAGRLAFEVLRSRHVFRHRGHRAKVRRGFEREAKRHARATRHTCCEHSSRVETDFSDQLVGQRVQESDVIDVERVRAEVADDVAPVPVALVSIGIDDGKTMFVRKAIEAISCLDSHLCGVFT